MQPVQYNDCDSIITEFKPLTFRFDLVQHNCWKKKDDGTPEEKKESRRTPSKHGLLYYSTEQYTTQNEEILPSPPSPLPLADHFHEPLKSKRKNKNYANLQSYLENTKVGFGEAPPGTPPYPVQVGQKTGGDGGRGEWSHSFPSDQLRTVLCSGPQSSEQLRNAPKRFWVVGHH